MLPAHPSISNSTSEENPRTEPALQKKANIAGQGSRPEINESSEMAPIREYEHDMDHAIDDAPIHPLASHPSSTSKSQQSHGSPSSPSISSFQPQQHQQLVKLKSEYGHPQSTSQQTATPGIVMTRDDTDNIHPEQDMPSPSPVMAQREMMEELPHEESAHPLPHHEKGRLVVDTSSGAIPPVSARSTSIVANPSTPTTAYLTPESGTAAPSSRRSSLRTMPATLPRSPLQVETIALFKQYKSLIPCAKCNSRNTIQRDGMSDGNLRFKCRPPVSMNITCGKSYSESKIRNMIANVVYGNNLPEAGTPTSANGSSENILAMAPPSSIKSARRQSRKNDDHEVERLQQMREEQHREYQENSMGQEHQQSYEEMNINGGHPHPVDDRRILHDRIQGMSSRRPSEQVQYRRPSTVGDDSMMMDYDDSMPPPQGHHQHPGTPPMDSDDPRLYRSQSMFGARSATPSGQLSTLNSAVRKGTQKLHHSQSHPNIGQQRQQQLLEQQEFQHREHHGSVGNHGYPPPQQRLLQRQVLRRESAQYQGNMHDRPEAAERRFSHPAALQSSSSGRFLSAASDAHPSSRRSSPGHESQHQASGKPTTPQVGSLLGGQFEEAGSPASQYQRRMSQPHPSDQRSYNQPPPPPHGPHQYDRRVSDAEAFSYQRDKHDRPNGNGVRHLSKALISPYSPVMSHNDGSLPTPPQPMKTQHGHSSPQFRTPQHDASYRHAYLRQGDSTPNYYQQPRRDDGDSDPYAPESLSAEEGDERTFARMRNSYKKVNLGQPLTRTSSHPNLYGSSLSSSKELSSSIPRNAIKLTCFPNINSSENATHMIPTSTSLNTSDAVAMKLAQSSKVVIEITQPRDLQAFKPTRSSSFSVFESVPGPLNKQVQRPLRHAASQPNLLARSASSVLGRRRSVSPDGLAFGSSKKRRADSVTGSTRDDDETPMSSSSVTAAEAAAAAVVAAAASAARQQNSTRASPSEGLQIVGLDYSEDKRNEKEIGLGVQVPSNYDDREQDSAVDSPTIEALGVAKASSYVPLEEQKELGIDYSLFTRVETAAWRILIPPNVVASFRSEDFGLTLKPKVEATTLDADVAKLSLDRVGDESDDSNEEAMDVEQDQRMEDKVKSMEIKDCGDATTLEFHHQESQSEPAIDGNSSERISEKTSTPKNAMETEEDELVDE
ncbi:hypothetical protein BGZ76_009833 [Entomortierella beljakovae]|nr:hypothetical protein BGZ76_009833 [Entomortierella beljakovae]